MDDIVDDLPSEFCPSTSSPVKDIGVPQWKSPEKFKQRDKVYKSDLSSASRLSRRICRRQRVLYKPLKLAPILASLQLRDAKLRKAKRQNRKTIFWLRYQVKVAHARAEASTAKANMYERRFPSF